MRRPGPTTIWLVALGAFLGASPVGAGEMIVLTEAGTLFRLHDDRPQDTRAVAMAGCPGRLIGVDVRPRDQRIYGVTDTNDVVRLDLDAGRCTLLSTLTIPFSGAARSGIDFNPQSDRLRCMGADRQNLRIHPTLGATAVDTALAYQPTDPNAGRRPEIAGAAYTNNRADAQTTRLLEIDAATDALVLQEPPNDGALTTIGPLGVDVETAAGFDIATAPDGTDGGWMATRGTLYRVDLTSGHATPVGPVGGIDAPVVSLACLPETPRR